MTSNGQVTIDAGEAVKLLDQLDKTVAEIHKLFAEGPQNNIIAKAETVTRTTLDLSQIKWKIKGGADATPSDGFAFAYTSDRNTGQIYPELKEIVNELNRGPVTQNGYRIGLSKDGKFLQRTKV